MKYAYPWARPLLAALFLFMAFGASAQQAWRPFRPGLIYSYALRDGTIDIHTLRVDSAYQAASGDSVYTFNRLIRHYSSNTTTRGTAYVKSRNNLFGARMRWVPGQSSYWLESDAQPNVQTATSLRIYPRAAIGQTWVASTTPLITAIVEERNYLRLLNTSVQDSVITIGLRYGTATTGTPAISFSISRLYGVLEATPWLGAATANTSTSAPLMAELPAPLVQTLYSPLVLFRMQPGDELGYHNDPFYFGPAQCQESYTLRRILTRQQRVDSLVFTYQEQTRSISYGYPFCGGIPASNTVTSIMQGRLAVSLRTGRSSVYNYSFMPLLTGEYAQVGGASSTVIVQGLPLTNRSIGNCGGTGSMVSSEWLYPSLSGGITYYQGLDGMPWQQHFSTTLGLGDVYTGYTTLVYYRRSTGSPLVCGSFANFTNLLPARAAEAASIATLHPNPAAEAATLTLAQPARAGHSLRLTDALGRQVWSMPLTAGQATATVPLTGQPAGLYLLHLSGPATNVSWKLTHE